MPLSESFRWLIDSRCILTVNTRRHHRHCEKMRKYTINRKYCKCSFQRWFNLVTCAFCFITTFFSVTSSLPKTTPSGICTPLPSQSPSCIYIVGTRRRAHMLQERQPFGGDQGAGNRGSEDRIRGTGNEMRLRTGLFSILAAVVISEAIILMQSQSKSHTVAVESVPELQPPNDEKTATRLKMEDGDDVTGTGDCCWSLVSGIWDYCELGLHSVASKFSCCLRELLRCFRVKPIRQSYVQSGIGTVVHGTHKSCEFKVEGNISEVNLNDS